MYNGGTYIIINQVCFDYANTEMKLGAAPFQYLFSDFSAACNECVALHIITLAIAEVSG
jgi:hypothetical protein